MILSAPDIFVLTLYLVIVFSIGAAMSRRASRSTEEFFVSGRSLPWWIVGTSMVATTFAADTPLVVSGLVAQGGIFRNWIWWYWAFGAVLTVFLFAPFWNRARITTDAELVELRYDGRSAKGLRFYRAAWFGIFQNVLIIAWVMRAMAKIILVVMGWDSGTTILGIQADVFTVLALFVIAVTYTALSGLWGVVVTDVLQFALAMGGSIYLALATWSRLGGLGGILSRLSGSGFDPVETLRIIPAPDRLLAANPFTEFLLLVLVVWWAEYRIDGGGYLSQRLFAAKNERHSVFAYLWFVVAHICVRPWPWIIVGLSGMAVFGQVGDPETYYPLMMKEILPRGIFGIVLASFFAAFMSTIDTQLNWGSSLVVNDLLRRFLWRGKSDKSYIRAARLTVVGLAVLGALASFAVSDISFAWKLIVSITAGIGSVYIARWYWWRVNAWSEISAMVTAGLCTLILAIMARTESLAGSPVTQFPYSTVITFLIVVPVWITVTMLTRPVGDERLVEFYSRVRPGGRGWERIRERAGVEARPGTPLRTASKIVAGIVLVMATLVGTGSLIFGAPLRGFLLLGLASAAGAAIYILMRGDNRGEMKHSGVNRVID
jgi:Na+/proline symporter